MNLLIVDDEPIIRIGLRTLVDWEKHGLRLIGEAADGREALEKIKGGDVDILVTDIRMPRMDGLELIRNARQVKEDLGVLVLSCLDDFSFVKEAMKLGASDYILKPTMEPDELVDILLGMKASIIERRSVKRQFSEWQTQLEQSKLYRLSQRVTRYLESGKDDGTLENDLFPDGKGIFSALVLHPQGQKWTEDVLAAEGMLAQIKMSDVATLHFFEAGNSLSKLYDYELRYRSAQRLSSMLEKGMQAEREENDYLICLGYTIKKLEELTGLTAWHEQQRYARFYGATDRIVWEAGSQHASAAPLPYELRNDLLKSVAHQNVDGIFHHTEQLCLSIAAAKPALSKLHAFLFELLVMASGYARENGYSRTDEFEQNWVSMPRLQSFFHVDALSRWLQDAMRRLWASRFSGAVEPASGNPFIRKALAFMKYNYMRNIGTVDIAESVKLSRSYLSDLYSREMSESLIETLTRIRIEEAKKRLSAGDRKIYEVAEEVGFSDPKSFAKTFKRIVGCTPKEYESQRKQG